MNAYTFIHYKNIYYIFKLALGNEQEVDKELKLVTAQWRTDSSLTEDHFHIFNIIWSVDLTSLICVIWSNSFSVLEKNKATNTLNTPDFIRSIDYTDAPLIYKKKLIPLTQKSLKVYCTK